MFRDRAQSRLDELKARHRYRSLAPSAPDSFVHNDYLGLSAHPEIREAGRRALESGAAGSRGSRLLGGNDPAFEALESRIAAFFGAPAALFFSTGYLANLAAVTALGAEADGIWSDEKNHASLIDGVRLAGKPRVIVPHGRWAEAKAEGAPLLLTESLFSMDGDWADWKGIGTVMERSAGFLLVDEAHAAGVFPADGKGMARGRLPWDRMAMVVTFGKAFGVAGAAVVGARWVRELLVNTARPFIYTTATSPAVAAMVEASLLVMEREGEARRRELWARAERVRDILGLSAPDDWHRRSPIVPIRVPGEERALRFCRVMGERGVEVRAVRYPTVPAGEERVRISLNLGVDARKTEAMAKAVSEVWKAFSSPERTPT